MTCYSVLVLWSHSGWAVTHRPTMESTVVCMSCWWEAEVMAWISVCERHNVSAAASHWGALWETNEFMGRTETYPGTAERTGGQTGGRSTDRPRSTQKNTKVNTHPHTHTQTNCIIHWVKNTTQHTRNRNTQNPQTSLCSWFRTRQDWTLSRLKVIWSQREKKVSDEDKDRKNVFFSAACSSHSYHFVLQTSHSVPLSLSWTHSLQHWLHKVLYFMYWNLPVVSETIHVPVRSHSQRVSYGSVGQRLNTSDCDEFVSTTSRCVAL